MKKKLGSLDEFLQKFHSNTPKIKSKPQIHDFSQLISKSNSPKVRHSISQSDNLKDAPKSMMIIPRLKAKKNRFPKIQTKSLTPIGTYEKVHQELM